MAVLGFLAGLLLMLGFYIIFSLTGTILISYLARKTLQGLYYILSIRERIRKQNLQFVQRKLALEERYQSQKDQFKQKTRHRQQSLDDANTKTQLHLLAKETLKKVRYKQNNVPAEIQYSTKKAIKQCVNQLDMERLIDINLSLSSPLNKLSHSQHSTQKVNQKIQNEWF